MSTIFLTSQRNALKRDPSSGTTNMAAPKISAYSGSLFVTNLVIAHNLGYPPIFRYYYEPFGDGIIWPSLSGRIDGNAANPLNLAVSGPGIVAWVDNVNMYIQIFYSSAALNTPIPVYWVIYRDFIL